MMKFRLIRLQNVQVIRLFIYDNNKVKRLNLQVLQTFMSNNAIYNQKTNIILSQATCLLLPRTQARFHLMDPQNSHKFGKSDNTINHMQDCIVDLKSFQRQDSAKQFRYISIENSLNANTHTIRHPEKGQQVNEYSDLNRINSSNISQYTDQYQRLLHNINSPIKLDQPFDHFHQKIDAQVSQQKLQNQQKQSKFKDTSFLFLQHQNLKKNNEGTSFYEDYIINKAESLNIFQLQRLKYQKYQHKTAKQGYFSKQCDEFFLCEDFFGVINEQNSYKQDKKGKQQMIDEIDTKKLPLTGDDSSQSSSSSNQQFLTENEQNIQKSEQSGKQPKANKEPGKRRLNIILDPIKDYYKIQKIRACPISNRNLWMNVNIIIQSELRRLRILKYIDQSEHQVCSNYLASKNRSAEGLLTLFKKCPKFYQHFKSYIQSQIFVRTILQSDKRSFDSKLGLLKQLPRIWNKIIQSVNQPRVLNTLKKKRKNN